MHPLEPKAALERRHSCRQNPEAPNVSAPSTETPTNNGNSAEENRTNPDKNGGRLKSDESNSTTCDSRDLALVRFTSERRHSCRQNSEPPNVSAPSTETPTNNGNATEENRTNPDKNGGCEKSEQSDEGTCAN